MLKDTVEERAPLEEKPAATTISSGSSRTRNKLVTAVAVAMSVYTILFVSRVFDNLGIFIPQVAHNSLFLAFLLTLCFLLLPARKGELGKDVPWYDFLIILLAIVGPVYNFFTWKVNAERYTLMDYHPFEIGFAFTTIIAVLEATRRALGLAMPIVAVLFLLHMLFGSHFSGALHVRPVTLLDLASAFVYYDTGIYGIALAVAASLIFMFILFSQFMFACGAGDIMMGLAISLLGHVRGGPAKVSVVASGLMGMVSGSTTANIASTGVFTIPMMKRIGYRPEFAGAVETVASNGGQIMPPVMGLVAFVIAQWLGIRYWTICLVSFIPAFLYYIAVFIMIDAEAARLGLRGMPRSECPPLLNTLKKAWIFLLPLLVLMFFLGVLMYPPEMSVLYALASMLLLSLMRWTAGLQKRGGITAQTAAQNVWKIGLGALKGGSVGMLMPGVACACAGIIIGALSVTQIGLVLSHIAVALAGDNQLLLLALGAFACLILGMGMSSLPAYILVVIVVAPALLKFGVSPLAAHLFIFWFAIVSFITPPVAIGAYVAAGIAGADPMKTGLVAVRLGFCTYTLPFMFVYSPALLLQGSVGEIMRAVLTSLVGVSLLSWGIGGYFLKRENLPQRLLLLAAGITFVTMEPKMVIVGVVLGAIVTAWQTKEVLRQRSGLKPSLGQQDKWTSPGKSGG